jgi:hypothetical protein
MEAISLNRADAVSNENCFQSGAMFSVYHDAGRKMAVGLNFNQVPDVGR